MAANSHSADFAGAEQRPATCARTLKFLLATLLLAVLCGGRASGEERTTSSFVALQAETLLGSHLLDLNFLNPGSTWKSSWGFLGRAYQSSLALTQPLESLHLELFSQYHAPRLALIEPGIGKYFPNDIIGRSRIAGAGLEENRWIFLKFNFRF